MQASKDPLPEESYGTHLFSPTISCDNILNCHIPEKFIKDTVSKVSKGDKSHRHSLSRMSVPNFQTSTRKSDVHYKP